MRRKKNLSVFLVVVALLAGCSKPESVRVTEVLAVSAASLPSDPNDPAWKAAPEFVARLLPQDLVEPRQINPTTPEVRVRALYSSSGISLRLQWIDPTRDNSPGASRFADACAIQVPSRVEPTVPAPQMGEPGKPVEVTYWNAEWQAIVDGRGDMIQDIYPGASVDHYPFQAASLAKDSAEQKHMESRYSPALQLGNSMGGPRLTPVQDLVAEGPGTLSPAAPAGSTARGRREADGWSVVITRKLPGGLSAQNASQIALAIWDGSHQEVGARKMRTAWIPLTLQAKP